MSLVRLASNQGVVIRGLKEFIVNKTVLIDFDKSHLVMLVDSVFIRVLNT